MYMNPHLHSPRCHLRDYKQHMVEADYPRPVRMLPTVSSHTKNPQEPAWVKPSCPDSWFVDWPCPPGHEMPHVSPHVATNIDNGKSRPSCGKPVCPDPVRKPAISILCYTILYYTTLHYTILYYTILYCTTLYYTILYYTTLYYAILYYTTLCYTILHYTILYYTTLYYTMLCYTTLYYAMLYRPRPEAGEREPPGRRQVPKVTDNHSDNNKYLLLSFILSLFIY